MSFDYTFYKPSELAAGMKGSTADQKLNFPPVTRPDRSIVADRQSCTMTTEYKNTQHSGAVAKKANSFK
jgi:hypothetical protein